MVRNLARLGYVCWNHAMILESQPVERLLKRPRRKGGEINGADVPHERMSRDLWDVYP